MRSAPFPSLRVTVRVFVKAVVLLVIFNLVCAAAKIDLMADVTRFNTWWLVGHGRARLVYPSDFQNGQLPVGALLGAHALAYTPKAPDEYRVVVLGESGIMGWGLADQETFTAQLTARHIEVGGKRLVAYNLAYPSPNVARDVLILDGALAYHPDLVIWFVSPAALDNSPSAENGVTTNNVIFELNRDRLRQITDSFDLQGWYSARFPPDLPWQSWTAIRGQDTLPVWLNSLLYPFVAPDVALTSRRIGKEPIPATAQYTTIRPGFAPMPNETWRFLEVGRSLAGQVGAKLLLINEPMLVGSGPNSDVNYNLEYQRALYDTYRQTLTYYAQQNNFWFVDLWNVIPASSFMDTPLHSDAAGYAILAEYVSEELSSGERTGQ